MISNRKIIQRNIFSDVCFFIIFSCLCVNALGEELIELKPHEANYDVSIKGFTGELKTSLRNTDAFKYHAEDKIKTTGLAGIFLKGAVISTAEFFIQNDKLKPHHFYSKDTISKEKKELTLNFDWTLNQVSIKENDLDSAMPINDSIKDRITLKYALMTDLINNRLSSQYSLYEGDKIKKIETTNLGFKIITLDHGEYRAVGIRNQALGSSKLSILWCAEELGFLPVLIEQYRNNKLWMSASLISYKEII
ncbi:MAG: DUF3108 domain-containing protein [Woeseiaceae bacterium]|nr:DUF3108 domain-containing protein [Woeseiaceae bacterium]